MGKLKYPVNCITANDKLEFCYIAQEKLRLEHNNYGKNFRDGKITEKEWKEYLINSFQDRHNIIVQAMLKEKAIIKKSTRFLVDLDNLKEAI